MERQQVVNKMIYIQVSEALQNGGSAVSFIDVALLENAALQTLCHQAQTVAGDLTLVITNDEQLRALNRDFLGIESTTDVLSFPSGEVDLDSQVVYLGDVVISYPRARLQAEVGGHALEDELCLLVVHGVLHLLGYDHAEEMDQARMWAVQAEILVKLGARASLP